MNGNQRSWRTVCGAAILATSVVGAVGVAYAADDRLAAQDEVTADGATRHEDGTTAVVTASIQPNGVGRAPILGLLLGLAMIAFSLARRTSR